MMMATRDPIPSVGIVMLLYMYPLIMRATMRTVLVIFFPPEEMDEPRLTAVRSYHCSAFESVRSVFEDIVFTNRIIDFSIRSLATDTCNGSLLWGPYYDTTNNTYTTYQSGLILGDFSLQILPNLKNLQVRLACNDWSLSSLPIRQTLLTYVLSTVPTCFTLKSTRM